MANSTKKPMAAALGAAFLASAIAPAAVKARQSQDQHLTTAQTI